MKKNKLLMLVILAFNLLVFTDSLSITIKVTNKTSEEIHVVMNAFGQNWTGSSPTWNAVDVWTAPGQTGQLDTYLDNGVKNLIITDSKGTHTFWSGAGAGAGCWQKVPVGFSLAWTLSACPFESGGDLNYYNTGVCYTNSQNVEGICPGDVAEYGAPAYDSTQGTLPALWFGDATKKPS